MTVPDPEERDRQDAAPRDHPEDVVDPDPVPTDHPGRADSTGGPDTDDAFASIVAGWRTEPSDRPWPAQEDRAQEDRRGEDRAGDDEGADPDRLTRFRSTGQRAPDEPDDDHFQPPEPPPLPVPQPRTLGGMLLVGAGAVLLVYPSLLAFSNRTGLLLGLLCVAAGIGWLVLGLRTGPPSEGWDDGARL